MDNVIHIPLIQMACAYLFVLLLLLMVRIKGIRREREILLSSIRMTLQLILTGYVLVYLFKVDSIFLTIITFIVMEIFSIFTILKRIKLSLSKKMKQIIAFSMATGTTMCLVYFLFIVIRIKPWYDARYFIPISGMLIGNSMTGISLCVTRLVDGVRTKKNLVEGALMLGATPKMAVRHIVDDAFDAAILPTINSMVGMGIVFLPGMMTGQILSGTSPVTAIQYQIAIMLGILGSVSITIVIFLQLGYQSFFNEDCQLIEE